jgi:hypothetical protein
MKLISPAEFVYKNGQFFYMDRVVSANQINVKSRLTVFLPQDGNRKVIFNEGVYSIEDLKTKLK